MSALKNDASCGARARHWQFGASSILRQQKPELNGLVAIVEPIQSITAQLDLVVKPYSG